MANIIIDGYNFIGIAHRNLEQARNDLIQKLDRYARIQGHNIAVVFDGWKDGQATETRKRIGDITVIYSSIGEKADDVIKNMLSSPTKLWIAVSSDREIYDFAEKKYCVALKADEFEKKLRLALEADKQNEGKYLLRNGEDCDLTLTYKKGNRKKISKKDKRKMEALKKL